jgi:hypothetical protein
VNASEKDFIAAGAECVAGDLIYNRVVVGRYRGGTYIPTEEGMLLDLPAPAAAAAPEPEPEPPKPAAIPARKTTKKPAAAAPAAAPPSDPLADLGDLGLEDVK